MSENAIITKRDSPRRSVAKALTWRVTATTDTIILAFLFIGDVTAALSIGVAEIATKSVLYYLHERIWAYIAFGEDATSNKRSLAKAITWRITGSLDTILLAFLFTHDLARSASLGIAESITKTVLYYLHERIWARIKWGYNPLEDEQDS